MVDSLLVQLNEAHYYCQFYADDGAIILVGFCLRTLCDLMAGAFRMVERWCDANGLSVSPEKLELVLFTRKRKLEGFRAPRLYGTRVDLVSQVKYLGVILDSKLTWKQHLDARASKAITGLWQARRALGPTWGLTPKVSLWIYTAVIRPMLVYGAVVWWERVCFKTVVGQLDRVQRLACLSVTGAMRSAPTAALEVLLGICPLDIFIFGHAMRTSYQLVQSGGWKMSRVGHSGVWDRALENIPLFRAPSDVAVPRFCLDHRFEVLIPDREVWLDGGFPWDPGSLVCFTDGSKVGDMGNSGAGIFIEELGIRESLSLGQLTTVPQTELLAIMECCRFLLDGRVAGQMVVICSDSRRALAVLISPKV